MNMKRMVICALLLVMAAIPGIADAAAFGGKVTEWVQGRQSPLSDATVLIGNNIWLETDKSYDVVRGGKVVAKVVTDSKGQYTINAPAGKYQIIIWKAGYIPSHRTTVTIAGTYNGSISRDTQPGASGRHRELRYQ